jgi:hypothetical protein
MLLPSAEAFLQYKNRFGSRKGAAAHETPSKVAVATHVALRAGLFALADEEDEKKPFATESTEDAEEEKDYEERFFIEGIKQFSQCPRCPRWLKASTIAG